MMYRLRDIFTFAILVLQLLGLYLIVHNTIYTFARSGRVPFAIYAYLLVISTPIELCSLYINIVEEGEDDTDSDNTAFTVFLVCGTMCLIAAFLLLSILIKNLDPVVISGAFVTTFAGLLSYVNAYIVQLGLREVYISIWM